MERKSDDGIWLEVCTENLEDWKTFLGLCVTRFQQSAPFVLSHPEPQKRKRFLVEYFKNLYETALSGGRAGLACAKKMNDNGKVEIVYAICISFNKQRPTPGDTTAMWKIDEAGADINLGEDQWLEDEIHKKFRKIAKQLNFNTMYVECHVTAAPYAIKGLSKIYSHVALEALYQDGIRRNLFNKDNTITYGIVDDPRVLRVQTDEYLGVDIAHLHKGKGQISNCLYGLGSKNNEKNSKETTWCVVVFIFPAGKKPLPTELVFKIRHLFSLSSHL